MISISFVHYERSNFQFIVVNFLLYGCDVYPQGFKSNVKVPSSVDSLTDIVDPNYCITPKSHLQA
jgi:hypothetical protein